MEKMKEILGQRSKLVENFLLHAEENFPLAPPRLKEAMLYSLNAGGKRIRPVLCLTCASLFGLELKKALPFASAIEMIHTYSLIHDDLPAMDDDDLRRGRPSNHKAFDEATAILAGDGLLTDAFYIISSMPSVPQKFVLEALAKLALAAGSAGMVGGQMLDMIYTGEKNINLEQLKHMQALKTGALLEASCVCGAMLAGASGEELENIALYGRASGRVFQIVDDMLDVTGTTEQLGKPAGSDEAAGKNTWPSMIGLEKSRNQAQCEAQTAINALKNFQGDEAEFLRSLVQYIVNRTA